MWGGPDQRVKFSGSVASDSPPPDFWLALDSGAARAVSAAPAQDFWLDFRTAPPAQFSPRGDFWLPSGASADEVVLETAPLDSADWVLPRFDPELATPPHVERPEVPRDETMSQRRSRWLVQLLDIPSKGQRRQFRDYFDDLFLEFNSANTFRALAHLAVEGASADALRNACDCKRTLLQSAHLLMRRGPSLVAYVPLSGSVGLVSWARAYRMTVLCGGDNPMDHMDDAWIDAWFALSPSEPTFWVLLDYCEAMLNLRAQGYWELQAAPRAPASSERLFDNRGYAAWVKSAGGQLMYAIPDHVGVMYLETRSIVRRTGGILGE